MFDQMSGRANKGALAGLSAGDEGRDSHGFIPDARLPLIVERALERAHVEIYASAATSRNARTTT